MFVRSRLNRFALFTLIVAAATTARAADVETVSKDEQQPLVAATERLLQALEFVGSPLPKAELDQLQAAMKDTDAKASVKAIQAVLDPHVLAVVKINPESRVSAVAGPARKDLLQQGWRTFLVKVINEAGITPQLKIDSPNSATPYQQGKGPRERPQTVDKL